MRNVLIMAAIPPLTKKEEKDFTNAGIQLTQLLRYSMYNEYLIKTGKLDYDVIVIDDSLSFVDVYDACRQLHAASKAAIILLGGAPPKEMTAKAKDIGFDYYYQKPIEPRDLAERIKQAVQAAIPRTDPAPATKTTAAVLDEIVTSMEINVVKQKRPETSPVAEQNVVKVYPPAPGVTPTTNCDSNIWRDPKITGLMGAFLKDKIKLLKPEINLGAGEGFNYPDAENIMGANTKETVAILDSLVKQGLLEKRDFEKIMASPDGSMQLVPVEKCPTCDSSDLVRGQLIEHFSCGHIGLEAEFMQGMNQVCPKCHHELKLIGTDYRKPGMRYICNSCHGIFPTPTVKSRCLKTGKIYNLEDLHYVSLYTYTLNEACRQKLEFEMEPKKQLLDYLTRLGYAVQEAVQVQGRSGANHKIDVLATMDELVTRHTVAIGILASPQDDVDVSIDPLFNFDSKIYDSGIDNKMVIAMPRFTPEAMKFAERQGIRVYNLDELRSLLSLKNQLTQTVAVNAIEQVIDAPVKPENIDFTRTDPRDWLKNLLEKRGYIVQEKLKVVGRSGAEHILDLYAQKDDGIINHKLAACVITEHDVLNSDVNEVMQFDTAAYDAHILDKVLISVPALSKEARQFAEYQRIKIIETKDLNTFANLNVTENAVGNLGVLVQK